MNYYFKLKYKDKIYILYIEKKNFIKKTIL